MLLSECNFEKIPLAVVLSMHCWVRRGRSRKTDYCNNPGGRYDGLDQGGNGGGGEKWLCPSYN